MGHTWTIQYRYYVALRLLSMRFRMIRLKRGRSEMKEKMWTENGAAERSEAGFDSASTDADSKTGPTTRERLECSRVHGTNHFHLDKLAPVDYCQRHIQRTEE
jgi:hypothetical protein